MIEWISVKDRLPEATCVNSHGEMVYSDAVIVFMVFEDDYAYVTVDRCDVTTKHWFHEGYDVCRVTHWMPLPEPPDKLAEKEEYDDENIGRTEE